MASSSTMRLFFIFHVGGECMDTFEGETMYVGGITSGRLISKGMTSEELRRIVAKKLWLEVKGFKMRFKVNYGGNIDRSCRQRRSCTTN